MSEILQGLSPPSRRDRFDNRRLKLFQNDALLFQNVPPLNFLNKNPLLYPLSYRGKPL
jgi:hypothetical protein